MSTRSIHSDRAGVHARPRSRRTSFRGGAHRHSGPCHRARPGRTLPQRRRSVVEPDLRTRYLGMLASCMDGEVLSGERRLASPFSALAQQQGVGPPVDGHPEGLRSKAGLDALSSFGLLVVHVPHIAGALLEIIHRLSGLPLRRRRWSSDRRYDAHSSPYVVVTGGPSPHEEQGRHQRAGNLSRAPADPTCARQRTQSASRGALASTAQCGRHKRNTAGATAGGATATGPARRGPPQHSAKPLWGDHSGPRRSQRGVIIHDHMLPYSAHRDLLCAGGGVGQSSVVSKSSRTSDAIACLARFLPSGAPVPPRRASDPRPKPRRGRCEASFGRPLGWIGHVGPGPPRPE